MDLASIQKFLTLVIEYAPQWADEGWGGYITPGAMTTQASGFVMMTPKLNLSAATQSMEAISDFAASLANLNIGLNHSVTSEPSYYSAYQTFLETNEEVSKSQYICSCGPNQKLQIVGTGTAISSRLIPRNNFLGTTNQTALLNAMLNVVETVTYPFATPADPIILSYGAPVQASINPMRHSTAC